MRTNPPATFVSARPRLALAGLIALAVALRIALASYPFWVDEVASLYFAHQPLSRLWSGWAAIETNPPLFYSLLHVWLPLAGQSEAAIRWLTISLGAASIALAFALARIITGRAESGLFAAALLAVSPQHIYFSHQVRGYILGYCGAGLALVAAALLLRDRKHGLLAWATYGAGLLVALYAHTTFAFFALLLNLGMLAALGVRRPRALTAWAATSAIVAVGYAWWAAITLWQTGHSEGIDWIRRPGLGDLGDVIVGVFLPPVSLLLRIAAGVVGFAGLAVALRKRPLPVAALIALAIGGVATLFIVSQWVPVLLIRTAFWATLPLTVAVAIGLAEIPWRWLRYSLLVLLLIIEANGLRHWIPLRDVDHWPEATAWTLQLKDRPLVVAQDEVVAVPLQYYCRKAAGAACPLRVRVVDQPEPAWSRGVTGYPRSDVRQALDAAYTEGRFVALNWKMHDLTADIVRDGRFRRAARFGDAGGAETELWVARR